MAAEDIPFAIVIPTVYGRMIVNRHDTRRGADLIQTGQAFDHAEIANLATCLRLRGGEGLVLDVGANIGTHALAFAAVIGPGRHVHAFEAQRMVFNMLAGNMALNGAANVRCHHLAIGDHDGFITAPRVDYRTPQNFGEVSFSDMPPAPADAADIVAIARLDSMGFDQVALIKIDVEGMELRVLDGAVETIARTRPIIHAEHSHSDWAPMSARLEGWNYELYRGQRNVLAVPREYADRIPVQVR